MDNASYHSVIKEGTKAPTSTTRKEGMQKWLKDKNIPFDGKINKTELHEIIKLKKPEPVYKTDEFLRVKGHDVLRHPHTIVNLTLSKWYGGMSRVMLDGKITLLKLMM
jgi:hypothetical protein